MLNPPLAAAATKAPAARRLPLAAIAFEAAPLSAPLPAPPVATPLGDHYLVIARHRAGNYAPERDETDLVSRERTVRDSGHAELVAKCRYR